MASAQTDDPKIPPDKGKEWMDVELPHTDEEEPFGGFSEQEIHKDNQQRKRRETEPHQDNHSKHPKTTQTQPNTRSQTSKQSGEKVDNTQTENTHNTSEKKPTGTKPKNVNKNDKPIWIQNNQHNVLFIEPISIKEGAKLLEPMEVGKFLHQAGLDQFTQLKRAGQYRYKLIYKQPKDAEKILNSTQTLKQNNYKAFIPQMLLETTGIIKNVPTSLTEQELFQNTTSDKKILRIERIKKRKDPKDPKSALIDTRTIRIIFEGSELPRTVSIYGVFEKPEPYIYPVRICTKCWRLGHKETACKSKKTCIKCGQYETENHTHEENQKPKCRNCGEEHFPTYKECKERLRMEHINVAMTVNKMTFQEAEELYPRPNIKTSNQFALLESTVEFPQMEQPSTTNTTFRRANQTITSKLDYRKIIQNMTNNPPKHPKKNAEIHKNTFPTVENYPEQVHVIENNPHKVTESEKLQTEQGNLTTQLQNIFQKITNQTTDNKIESDVLLIEIASMIQSLILLTTSHQKSN